MTAQAERVPARRHRDLADPGEFEPHPLVVDLGVENTVSESSVCRRVEKHVAPDSSTTSSLSSRLASVRANPARGSSAPAMRRPDSSVPAFCTTIPSTAVAAFSVSVSMCFPFGSEAATIPRFDGRCNRTAILGFTADVGTPTVWAARYLHLNGRRRLLGSFTHGSMANALPLVWGAQAVDRERQVVALAGGGLAMLMGDLLSIVQNELPVKIVAGAGAGALAARTSGTVSERRLVVTDRRG